MLGFQTLHVRLECEVLLAHALGKTRVHVKTWPEQRLTAAAMAHYWALLQRRQQGEPIAYLVAEKEFWSLSLSVSNDTLIPRPETEHLVETALALLPVDSTQQILDLGTGSGAIAIAIAHERPRCSLTAVDISPAALTIAQRNTQRHKLQNIHFVCSHWFEPLQTQFAMIVANPPYIAIGDSHLVQGDVQFEPMQALIGGEDGLDAIRTIIHQAPKFLVSGGYLLLEHGYDQQNSVIQLLQEHDFSHIHGLKDAQQHDRLVLAQKFCSMGP